MSRRERLCYAALLVISGGALLAFVGWWVMPQHVPHNFHGHAHVVDWVLFALLTLVFAHRLFMDAFTWIVAWGMRPEPVQGPPRAGLRVAFLTTFVPSSEPIELLQGTLPAMLSVDYPHDTWLLDEGNVAEVRELCERLGVRYFSRAGIRRYNLVAGPFTARTKGGNHNAWYDSFADDYDIVAQIDTDFVPRHDFLTKTLAPFDDEKVGFVGTPQVYGNLDESFVARGAAQQLFAFYGPIMRGLASRGQANMIGANHVVRVAALREVGLYAGHLTEDLLTGMRLHAAGWESRYVSEPLAVGEAPTTWQSYFNQQMRWAFGCIDILRRHSYDLLRRMRTRQGLLYLALQQHYFGGLASALGLALIINYFATGDTPADVSVVETLLWVTPLVVARQAVGLWLQRFNADPRTDRGLLFAGRYTSVVSWPVYLLAAVGVARQKRLVFKVTPKGIDQRDRTPFSMAYPHLAVVVLTGGCLLSAVFTHRHSLPMIFWAACNGLLMLSFVVAILAARWTRPPARRPALSVRSSGTWGRQRAASALVGSYVVDDHLLRPRRAG